MIILSATEALKGNPDYKVTDPTVWWPYLAIKIGENIFCMIFETNNAYGASYVRQWSVNGNVDSTIDNKYLPGRKLTFDCSSALCGTRLPEHDNYSFEFLFKPMGFTWEEYSKVEAKYNEQEWMWGPYKVEKRLKEIGIDYEVIREGNY